MTGGISGGSTEGNEDRDLEKRPEEDKLKPLWRTNETLRSLESRLSIRRQNRSPAMKTVDYQR